MTVSELIKELEKANQNSKVIVMSDRSTSEVTGVDLSHMNVANRYVFLDFK